MPVNFLEASVFVSPLTPSAEPADALFMEITTVLGLEKFVFPELFFRNSVD